MITLYNFAAESLYTKKPCSRIYSIEIEFYSENKKSVFEPPFGELRGNICTPSIAHWKARGQLPIRLNWTFFLSYVWNVIRENLSKSAFLEGVGQSERKFHTEGGVAHQPLLVSEN